MKCVFLTSTIFNTSFVQTSKVG